MSGILQVGLDAANQLLHPVPPQWRLILGVPLVMLALLVVTSVLVRLFGPLVVKLVNAVMRGLTTVVGLLALLPEFVISRGFRRLGWEPIAPLHIYGEAVEHLVTGGQWFFDGRLIKLVDDKKLRRALVLVLAVGLFVVADSGSCPGRSSCTTPGGRWWTTVVSSVQDTPTPAPSVSPVPPPPPPPAPSGKRTRKV